MLLTRETEVTGRSLLLVRFLAVVGRSVEVGVR